MRAYRGLVALAAITVAGCGSSSTHPQAGVHDGPVHAVRQFIGDIASYNVHAICTMMAPSLQTYTHALFLAESTCEGRVGQWIYQVAPSAARVTNVALRLESSNSGSAVVGAAVPGGEAQTRLVKLSGKWLIAGSDLFLNRLNPPSPLVFHATFRHAVPLRVSDPVRIGVVNDGRVLAITRASGSYKVTFTVDEGFPHNDASVTVVGSGRNAYLALDIGSVTSGYLAFGSQMPGRGASAK
jgi:hypothetical protein